MSIINRLKTLFKGDNEEIDINADVSNTSDDVQVTSSQIEKEPVVTEAEPVVDTEEATVEESEDSVEDLASEDIAPAEEKVETIKEEIHEKVEAKKEEIHEKVEAVKEEIQEKFGPGRLPTMRQIEKTAFIWANEEIMTWEMADAYIARRKERKDVLGEIKRMLGIWDRALTKTETDTFTDWLEKGFGLEAINMAFDRTVAGTGDYRLPYMNKIMQSWHSKGLHTPAEIETEDKPMGKKQQQPAARTQAPAASTPSAL